MDTCSNYIDKYKLESFKMLIINEEKLQLVMSKPFNKLEFFLKFFMHYILDKNLSPQSYSKVSALWDRLDLTVDHSDWCHKIYKYIRFS